MIAFDLNNLYIRLMRKILAPVTAFAFICLLAMQMSGVHSHVDADGNDAGLHGSHVLQADSEGHDHSTEIDVPLLEELGVFTAKLIPLLFATVLSLAAAVWIRQSILSLPFLSGKTCHRIRWWPPLRAPPLSN